jgi:hypothetical protein
MNISYNKVWQVQIDNNQSNEHSFYFFSSSFAAKQQNWIKIILVCIAAMQMEEAML